MSNNYEWQRHQINERIQDRLRDGELHRLAKEVPAKPKFSPFDTARRWLGSCKAKVSAGQKPNISDTPSKA